MERLEIPGPCEAIARTSDGYLVASFAGKGIYRREGEAWRLAVPYPYGPEEGKHWVHLAEDKGRIAFATGEYSTITDYHKGTRAWTGTSAIWIQKGNKLEKVNLGEETPK